MRILAFSDWRVQSIDELINFVKSLNEKPDVILYGGDDVGRFGSLSREVIIEDAVRKLECSNEEFCFLPSGDDKLFILGFKKDRKLNSPDRLKQILDEIKGWKKQYGTDFSSLRSTLGEERRWRIMRESMLVDRIAEALRLDHDYETDDFLNSCEILERGSSVLVLFGKAENAVNKFEELAKHSKYGVFGVIGNDCHKLHKHILNGQKVFDLHECPQVVNDYILIGQEGASADVSPPIGLVLYAEEEIEKHLKQQIKGNDDKKIILVSHSPPKGILDTAIRFSEGGPIGSSAVRKFIEKNKVILNVCGHAHYMGGKSEKLGKCTVVNIASHDDMGAKGKIAIIDIEEDDLNVKLTELPPSNLEAIYGIGYVYSHILKEAGIKSIKEFASLDPDYIVKKTNLSPKLVRKWHLHAKSLISEEITLLERIDIENPVFADIETDHAQSFVWMICVFDPDRNIREQFIAYKKKEEKKILEEFLDLITEQGYKKIYCYSGTDFEKRVLLDRIESHKLDRKKFPFFEDLLYKIRDVLVVPLTTYKLKELGSFLGFGWRHPDIDGFDAPILYDQFIKSKDKKIIRKLQEYNQDDVLVLWHILQTIKKMHVGKSYSISELQKL